MFRSCDIRFILQCSNLFRSFIMSFECFKSREELEKYRMSKRIDSEIRKESAHFRCMIKVLLLGAGESGKSTFLKQMRIIHGGDYSNDTLLEFKPIIYSNVLKGMKILVEARRKLGIAWGDPECQAYGNILLNYQPTVMLDLETFMENVEYIKTLWSDSGIEKVYKRRNEFLLV